MGREREMERGVAGQLLVKLDRMYTAIEDIR